MSAGSAQAQIPTRICRLNLDDLLVDARRDHTVDVDRLGDVVEPLLAGALENEGDAEACGGGRARSGPAAPGPASAEARGIGRGCGCRGAPTLSPSRGGAGL